MIEIELRERGKIKRGRRRNREKERERGKIKRGKRRNREKERERGRDRDRDRERVCVCDCVCVCVLHGGCGFIFSALNVFEFDSKLLFP